MALMPRSARADAMDVGPAAKRQPCWLQQAQRTGGRSGAAPTPEWGHAGSPPPAPNPIPEPPFHAG